MTGQSLLTRLADLGVAVVADGDKIRLQGTGPRPPRELLDQLQAHRREVVNLLRREPTSPDKLEAALGGTQAVSDDLHLWEILELPLEQFAQATLIVEVYSVVLEEPIVLASDGARLDPGERRVVYRAAEVRDLLGLPPDDLRQVHRVKKMFGGTVEAS